MNYIFFKTNRIPLFVSCMIVLFLGTQALYAQTVLSPYGAIWKYLDNGSNQGTAWYGTSFNDASWASGPAELGYGDGDEATVVSFGPSSTNKYITTYFRKNLALSNPNSFAIIKGKVKRDDGVAIYVNGTEVYRNNLAAAATYTTLASTASDNGTAEIPFDFSPSLLINGNNTIAVEIHQTSIISSDISFDLELTGSNEASLIRGPYLNMGNQTAVTVRWRSDLATNTKVEIGTSHGTYPTAFNNATLTTEHEIRLTGLSHDTKYFYRFGSTAQILQAGTDNYFVTVPLATTTRKMRFAVFGDCGRDDNGYQPQTLAAYQNYLGSNAGEVMVLLGDNAYTNGTDAEYQTGFFAPYQSSILKNHVIMPAPGNHDYYSSSQASRTGSYYQNFTIPANGECGGVPSNTEAFYSWDRGDAHFISLDSYGTENPNSTRLYDTTGVQVTWLKQDLAATAKKWKILYWHHPPYTMGSHNSDNETELVDIRTNLLRILERYGVDLIMCGHSHDYERSYLLKGHYGNESSFDVNTHTVTSSSGKYNGSANSCPYNLPNGPVNHGIVYVVSGSSGASGSTQAGYPHNAMPWSFNDGGMLQLEIEGNRLDGKFVRKDQVIADQFTIMKDVNKTTNLNIASGTSTQLTASWIGNYSWNTSSTSKSITVAPTVTTTYTVTDNVSCLTDVFNLTINAILSVELLNFQAQNQNQTNLLTWQTASEKGNKGFYIQRSLDGKDFKTIGFVKGQHTTIEKQSYSFIDETPFNISYYRLLQADFDEKTHLSQIIVIALSKSKAAFNVYPNPTTSDLTIEFHSEKEDIIDFELINTIGQVVLQHHLEGKEGYNQLNLNTDAFPKGQYILRIKQESAFVTKKVTIQ